MAKVFFRTISMTFLAFMVVVSPSYAQTTPLKPGDAVPDPALEAVNFGHTNVHLSDFRGKLVLLDFWATWCAPCIGLMPKTDSIARMYEKNLVVVPVTKDNLAVLKEFTPQFEKIYKLKLRSIISDTILHKLFAVSGLPKYGWVDKNGRMLGTSGPEMLTKENIDRILTGDYTGVNKVENRQLKFPDAAKSVFNVQNAIDSINTLPVFYSALSRHIPGYINMLSTAPPFNFINVTVEHLYQSVFGENEWCFQNPQRVFWEVNDSSVYRYSLQAEIDAYHHGAKTMHDLVDSTSFCYEAVMPPYMSLKSQYKWMQEDLNHYFGGLLGIQAHRERRNVQCLVLIRTSLQDKIRDTASRKSPYFSTVGDILATWFKEKGYAGMPPLEDGTGYSWPAKIDLPVKNLKDLDAANHALADHDLKLILQYRDIEVIVIKGIGDSATTHTN